MSGAQNDHLRAAAASLRIPVLILVPSDTECGIFSLNNDYSGHKTEALNRKQSSTITPKTFTLSDAGIKQDEWTQPDQAALVLHTSGTSGKKKIVPYTLRTMVVGAACISKSWQLKFTDINLNMMPLFHIGGIARNILSPILSGGAVIMCPGFDPSLFWDTIASGVPVTWYYASPTMHQGYVEEAKRRTAGGNPPPKSQIRFIANAAGALLPALAKEMQETFACAILPGYGMTECMPISAPPIDYQLEKHGTSGRAIGPELKILDGSGNEVQTGSQGNICVRGYPLFQGYENNEEANKKEFFSNGFFNTGDLGYMDADGYLFINGRSKEVINRGGEIISPFEVEEALVTHPDILTVICFAAEHDTLQETIGIACTIREGRTRPDIKSLQKWAAKGLHPSKWPQVVVFFDTGLPVGPGSGKPLRTKLGSRCKLAELTDATVDSDRLYEALCPPKGTDLKVPIECSRCVADLVKVSSVVRGIGLGVESSCAVLRPLLRGAPGIVCYVTPGSVDGPAVLASAADSGRLHTYELPVLVLPIDDVAAVAVGRAEALPAPDLSALAAVSSVAPRSQLEEKVAATWKDLLSMAPEEIISVEASFFEVGGNSLMAGQLAALVRKVFSTNMGVGDVFEHNTMYRSPPLLCIKCI